jgi:hypothetical protein
MESSPQSAYPVVTASAPAAGAKSPRKPEEKAYKTWTVVAIVLVLGSLWLF